jgi:hypothetical protein
VIYPDHLLGLKLWTLQWAGYVAKMRERKEFTLNFSDEIYWEIKTWKTNKEEVDI